MGEHGHTLNESLTSFSNSIRTYSETERLVSSQLALRLRGATETDRCSVTLVKTEKANGENAQVSILHELTYCHVRGFELSCVEVCVW